MSKYHPTSSIAALYKGSQHRVFGENYIQELLQKVAELSASGIRDIEWHVIGKVQSNKVKMLLDGFRAAKVLSGGATVGKLVVETVDSVKLVRMFQSRLADTFKDQPSVKVDVFIQVNTSGEDTKSGIPHGDYATLLEVVREALQSDRLTFKGLMTIGAPFDAVVEDNDDGTGDFKRLSALRDRLCAELSLNRTTMELSMGMSSDFELAIKEGSTNVRVGSSIFGARPSKEERKTSAST